MKQKAKFSDAQSLKQSIQVAQGLLHADLVLKNATYLDVFSGQFQTGDIAVHEDKIVGVGDSYQGKTQIDASAFFIVPGFIDAHVHIESSMMTPDRFQQAVLPNGTTTVIWDPHEIANVKGCAGIQWALDATNNLLLDVFIMVPSCVPSTSPVADLEQSGAALYYDDIKKFRDHPRVLGLAEMMNFPGLLHGEEDVLVKVHGFQDLLRDGHCPMLNGKELNAYATAGIHSCHESTSITEAAEKMSKGIHVLIREGSCAKDAEALLPILNAYTSSVVSLCSDDRNPLDIEDEGHISFIANLALNKGISPEVIFRAASYAPAQIYGLKDRGAIAPGYLADFVLCRRHDPHNWVEGFSVESVYKNGVLVREDDLKNITSALPFAGERNIKARKLSVGDLRLTSPATDLQEIRAIGVIPGQIVTKHLKRRLVVSDQTITQDIAQDLLKILVYERHKGTNALGLGFVEGFALKAGAIATSINHDSHNIICVGASDQAMVSAVNALIDIDGGIVVVDARGKANMLRLPVGGLMTNAQPSEIADTLRLLKGITKTLGCTLAEPFLTLSFLALPVIPALKITDRGLIDVERFCRVPLLV